MDLEVEGVWNERNVVGDDVVGAGDGAGVGAGDGAGVGAGDSLKEDNDEKLAEDGAFAGGEVASSGIVKSALGAHLDFHV